MTNFITSHKIIKKIMTKGAVFCAWIGVWYAAYAIVQQEILIVSPAAAWSRLISLCAQSSFWLTVGSSFLRITVGFLLALLVGALLSVLTFRFKLCYEFFHPLLSVIKATPVASFIILALVWIKSTYLSTFIAFLMVVPMVWENLYTGIGQTDQKLLELAKIYHFRFSKKLFKIYLPSVMPYLISACTTGLGFAWKAGIAAEVLGVPKFAIGTNIYQAKIYLETADLFAWTIVVIALSMLLETVFLQITKRVRKKYLVSAAKGE